MRPTSKILWETYSRNRANFNDDDREAARTALGIFKSDIVGAGLWRQFDCEPHSIERLLRQPLRHRDQMASLKAMTERFGNFIRLLEGFGDRAALRPDPLSDREQLTADIITLTVDPLALSAYKAFHAALVAYLEELDKEKPDWPMITGHICRIAHTVNPEQWRQSCDLLAERAIMDYGTWQFLEAILLEPPPET